MTKKKKVTSEFPFWKDNKIADKFSLTREEFAARLTAWLPTRERDWVEYYRSDMVMRFFITEKTGLSSVFDEANFKELYEIAEPIIYNFKWPAKA